MMRNALAASLLALAAALLAVPAGAQSGDDAARSAEALDRVLGPAADPPPPIAVTVPALTWPETPFPPWLAGQPYRQQPLLTSVPRGGTVGGRVRGSGVP